MTVNTSSTRELDIDTVIKTAYQTAGLIDDGESTTSPGFTGKRAKAANFLDIILKGLQAGAVTRRHMSRETIAITSGTATYALSTSILSVDGVATFKETGEDTELPVFPMDLETYQVIVDKTVTGRPTRYFHNRAATQQIILDPVPDADGTLTVQAHMLIADGDDVQYTVDLERHWMDYVVFELAHRLALSAPLPVNQCGYLRDLAEKAFGKAKRYSQDHVPTQFVVGHKTGWSRC